MNARCYKWQEEHREHLGIDTLSDLFLGHPHLLHDIKPRPIFVPFRDLFVVHDQHSSEDEHDAQQDSQEE